MIRPWLGEAAPHTDKLHVITKLHRPDLGHLEIETTFDDPGALKKPFTLKSTATLAPAKKFWSLSVTRTIRTSNICGQMKATAKLRPAVGAVYDRPLCRVQEITGGHRPPLQLLALWLLLAVPSVFAHHSFTAEYDSSKVRQFVGTVTKVEWTNPHARFYLDVKDDRGTVTNWNSELGALYSCESSGGKRIR